MLKIISFCLLLTHGFAFAQANSPTQDLSSIDRAAKDFLQLQTAGYPGEALITVNAIDNRLRLSECLNLLPFLPPGSKAWGKFTMGIRCTTPKPWTIYLSAQVKVTGDYYIAVSSLPSGRLIEAADLKKVTGDLTMLPTNIITTPSQAIGRTLGSSLAPGSPMRLDAFKSFPAVQQGQSVKIISVGQGFQISAEGQALNNADEGKIAKAKTISGQVITGIARINGIIEIIN
jgi:flagella basal body P-ring formation protein FlgA